MVLQSCLDPLLTNWPELISAIRRRRPKSFSSSARMIESNLSESARYRGISVGSAPNQSHENRTAMDLRGELSVPRVLVRNAAKFPVVYIEHHCLGSRHSSSSGILPTNIPLRCSWPCEDVLVSTVQFSATVTRSLPTCSLISYSDLSRQEE
jgi:hypothetical protein